ELERHRRLTVQCRLERPKPRGHNSRLERAAAEGRSVRECIRQLLPSWMGECLQPQYWLGHCGQRKETDGGCIRIRLQRHCHWRCEYGLRLDSRSASETQRPSQSIGTALSILGV